MAMTSTDHVTVRAQDCIWFTWADAQAIGPKGEQPMADFQPTAIDIPDGAKFVSIVAKGEWFNRPMEKTGPDGRPDRERPLEIAAYRDNQTYSGSEAIRTSGSSPNGGVKTNLCKLVGIWQIGDLAPPANNTTDEFVVGSTLLDYPIPAGATKLFLAFHDGYEWNNNTGAISADVTWSKGTIFISGYWPPTNIEVPNRILNQFKSGTQGTLGEYVIENYDETGYRLVTIAPKFPGQQEPDWGRGVGSWTVDYPDTSTTFWSLMKKYQPIAVMTTSRNFPDETWLLEKGSTNLAQADWNVGNPWNAGRPPFIGGSENDPASAPGLPNAGQTPEAGGPPDATRNQDAVIEVTADVKAIQELIMAKLDDEFAKTELKAEIAQVFQGKLPDNYVSAFAGYHAVWYDRSNTVCKAGWHTHVDYGISVPNATKAIKFQLEVLIQWLDNQ